MWPIVIPRVRNGFYPCGMQYASMAFIAALLASCGCAFGQATTNPASGAVATGIADVGPTRDRDATGHVTGPSRVGWWNDAVFYEVFVRSFKDAANGPLANDGIGDIPGLIEKLDYLNDGDPKTTGDLGITGIWLMPINPSPSYHGYDVTNYKDVNPQYGTLEDFRKLTAACHKRGIRVILDLVLNHCSDKHPWFAAGGAADPASAHHDWFTWAETNPGWKGPWNQQVWHRSGGGASGGPWYYGIFSGRMPDLNFRSAAVSEEMLSVVDFWVGKGTDDAAALGADGYRLDAIRHLIEDARVQENTPETHAWLRTMRTRLKAANPDAMSIGEVWTESKIASSYVGNELDMTFEFELASAIVEAARTGRAENVIAAQERVLKCYPPNQYGRFLTNHDQARVLTQLKGDAGAMRSAAAMLLLGPGVPFIYYGEELGMTGNKPDENLRTPMQWSGGETAGFTAGKPWEEARTDRAVANVERESREESSLLNWYRRLIRVRGGYAALSGGGFEPVESGNPGVYAFMRTGETPVVVVINLTNATVSEYALRVPAMENEKWIASEILHEGRVKTNPTGGKPVGVLETHQAYVLKMTPAKE